MNDLDFLEVFMFIAAAQADAVRASPPAYLTLISTRSLLTH
jgi:hypothetical protein